MAMMGYDCTVLEMAPQLNAGGNILQQNALGLQYAKYGIKTHTSTRALEITPEGVKAQTPDGEHFFEADTVVTAMGMRPLRDEALEYRLCAPDYYLVGDALASKSMREANWLAYQAALDIGTPMVL